MFGMILISSLVVFVTRKLDMSSHEHRAYTVIKRIRKNAEIKRLATQLIVKWLRVVIAKRRMRKRVIASLQSSGRLQGGLRKSYTIRESKGPNGKIQKVNISAKRLMEIQILATEFKVQSR